MVMLRLFFRRCIASRLPYVRLCPNLMKGRVKKELEQLKPLTLKIQEVTLKNVAVTKNE